MFGGGKKAKPLTKGACSQLPKKQKGAALSVLVFTIDGDDKETSRTNAVESSTAEAFGSHAEVHRAKFAIVLDAKGARDVQMAEARALVAYALDKSGHDAALWGDVASDRDVVNFAIQARGAGDPAFPRAHKLNDTIRLSPRALASIGPLIATRLSAECAPYNDDTQFVASALVPAVTQLERLLAADPAWLNANAKAVGWHEVGVALAKIGDLNGRPEDISRSIGAFSKAVQGSQPEQTPLRWGTFENSLGAALNMLGDTESGIRRYKEAADAFNRALTQVTRDRAPSEWAAIQSNLAYALTAVGVRENDANRIKEGVAAYREALKERARGQAPQAWAATHSNLANALLALGERENNTQFLEEAVASFQEALKEQTRARVPNQWAATQHNLAQALQALGARESGKARLEQALQTYREALKVRTHAQLPLKWAATQKGLADTLCLIGQREQSRSKMEEAIGLYEQVLREHTRERLPGLWADTTYALGLAQDSLGDKLKGSNAQTRYREAASKIGAAAEEFAKSAPARVSAAQAELARVRSKVR